TIFDLIVMADGLGEEFCCHGFCHCRGPISSAVNNYTRNCAIIEIRRERLEFVRANAAFRGKADMAFCAAHVCF
ncbi:MAG: hypothetical protein WBM31_05990, partial [Pseudolabrys sp.]